MNKQELLLTDEEIIEILNEYIASGVENRIVFGSQVAKAQLAKALPIKEKRERPRIVCLCGSTRFTDIMLEKQWWFTKYGFIVLSWCALPDGYFEGEDKAHIGDQENVKEIVDEVHLRKIDLADEVFVINVGGFIGDSTSREIAYAEKLGKPIKYLEALKGVPNED